MKDNTEYSGIKITTDCVCDLPEEYMHTNDIDRIFFYITTDKGRFRDQDEISSRNILEYIEESRNPLRSDAPAPEEYADFFTKHLKRHHRIIHITISSKVSKSYENACSALKLMGDKASRVNIVNSYHLSTGIGHIIIRAAELVHEGKAADEIIKELEAMRIRVSTSFFSQTADYLVYNGRISPSTGKLCSRLSLHPVLCIKEDGLKLKKVLRGSFEGSARKYIRGELKRSSGIDKKRLFITHAGCSMSMLEYVRAEVEKCCHFDEVIVTEASATISGNCGPGTFGLLYSMLPE